jgi:tetratricopeptide (TPR) repeat protein
MAIDLLERIDDWFDKNSIALEYEGQVNIEGGMIAVASSRFQEFCLADHNDQSDAFCECGRNEDNFISMLSGNGDGLYAVMTLRDHANVNLQNKISRTTRSIGYVIDCDTRQSDQYFDDADTDQAGLLDGLSISKYLTDEEPKLFHFGTVSNSDGIFISDKGAYLNSQYPIISSKSELCGKYFVFAICTDGPGMLAGAEHLLHGLNSNANMIVPRLILVVHQNYAGELLEISEKLPLTLSELEHSWNKATVMMHSEDQSKTAIWNNYLFKKNLGAFGPKSNFNQYASWILQGKEFFEDEFLEPWEIVSNLLTSWAARGDDPDLLMRDAIINLHNDRGMFEKSEEISVELIARHKGLESGAEKANDLCFGSYFPQNKLEDAEKLLLEVLNWHNLSERIIGITHGNLGIIEYRRKNYSRAKEFFNLSLSADSTDSESLYYLGCISFHENDKSLATSFWNKCSSQTGRYPELAILKLAGEQVTVIPEFTELARVVEFKDIN